MREIRLHGRGGQGVVLAAELLAVAAYADGKFGQALPAFGGERRGAPVQAFIRLSTSPIRLRHRVNQPDWIVVFDPSLLEIIDVLQGVKPGGSVLINTERLPASLNWPHEATVYTIPATRIALQVFGQPLVNPAVLGALAAVAGEPSLEAVQAAFRSRFPGDMGQRNSHAARQAYEWCLENGSSPVRVSRSSLANTNLVAWEPNPGLGATGPPLHAAAVVAPRTSLAYPTGTWRYHRPVFDQEKCTACGFCDMYCPDGCILVEGKTFTPDYVYCKGCGICARECPADAIKMMDEEA